MVYSRKQIGKSDNISKTIWYVASKYSKTFKKSKNSTISKDGDPKDIVNRLMKIWQIRKIEHTWIKHKENSDKSKFWF